MGAASMYTSPVLSALTTTVCCSMSFLKSIDLPSNSHGIATLIDDWLTPGDLIETVDLATLSETIVIGHDVWRWPDSRIRYGDVLPNTPIIVVAVTRQKFKHSKVWSACYVLTPTQVGWIGEDALGDPLAHEPRGGEHE